MKNIKYPPQFSYDKNWDRYCITLPPTRESIRDLNETSFAMVIEYHGNDEYTYRFICWKDGEWYECVTKAQYDQKVKDIEENEGDEVATMWEDFQENYVVIPNHHQVFELQQYWESIINLGLISIPLIFTQWEHKPILEEHLKKMNEARDKFFRDHADS